MVVKEHIAKQKTCILMSSSAGRFRPGKGDNCVASDCLAYWRWTDNTKIKGYCSLGSKPTTEEE